MSAPAVVLLLHSFGSAGRSWAAVEAELTAKSQAPDLPGFGGAPVSQAPSLAGYADWVLEQMRMIGGEIILVGASMGGKIAMAAAARRPQGLRALILCGPSPPTPEPIEDGERTRQLSAWGKPEEAERSVSQSTLRPRASPPFLTAVEDWLSTDQRAWTWWWSEGSRETIEVGAVAPGAIILTGEKDAHLGADVQKKTTALRLSRPSLEVVPKSGHLLALDAPASVAKAIHQFI